MTFAKIKTELMSCGDVAEFYMPNVNAAAWSELLHTIPTLCPEVSVEWGHRSIPMPETFKEVVAMQKVDPVVLWAKVAGETVTCHFFNDSKIELDFKARKFTDEAKWNTLLAFFQALVDRLGRKAAITHESAPDKVILQLKPAVADK